MDANLFSEFLISRDTLRVYSGDRLIFASKKDGLMSLIDYAGGFSPYEKDVTVFDRIIGNAAALLLSQMSCREVYSPLGSELAVETLRCFGINYHFTRVVPYIQDRSGEGMCPMEKLSLGRSPEEFCQDCLSLDSGHGS